MLCGQPCCDPETQAAQAIQHKQIAPTPNNLSVSTAVYGDSSGEDSSDDEPLSPTHTQAEPDREPTQLTEENVEGMHAMYSLHIEKDASDKWGMDIDTNFGSTLKVVAIMPGGAVEAYNKRNPNTMIQPGDFIIRMNGGPANCPSMDPAGVFAATNYLELTIRKGFTFAFDGNGPINNKTDPEDPRSPIPSPRSASNIPGLFTVSLHRQGDEKWGVDVDYGVGESLKIVGLGEKGAIKRHNDENPNRMIEVGDWICELNGQPGYAASGVQKATTLAHMGRKKLTMTIRKSYAKDGEILVKDEEKKTPTTPNNEKKEKKEKKIKDDSKLWV